MACSDDRGVRLAVCAGDMLLEEAVDWQSARIGPWRGRATEGRVQVAERGQERFAPTFEYRPGSAVRDGRWIVRRGRHQQRELAGTGSVTLLWERCSIGGHDLGRQVGRGHHLRDLTCIEHSYFLTETPPPEEAFTWQVIARWKKRVGYHDAGESRFIHVLRGNAQTKEPAPVLADERDALKIQRADERVQPIDVALVGVIGAIRRFV